MSYLHAIGVSNAPFCITQAQTLAFMQKIFDIFYPNNTEKQRELTLLYRATGIQQRYSVIEDFTTLENWKFFPNNAKQSFPTTAQRMDIFKQNAFILLKNATKNAFDKCNILPEHITDVILVSCTGMYAPSVDMQIIKEFGISTQARRVNIQFMGCYAGINALKVANDICVARDNANVLILDIELCTLHLQNSMRADDLLSGALFGDGAVASIISNQKPNKPTLKIKDFYCDIFFEGQNDMTWDISNEGFLMNLSTYVPTLLGEPVKNLTKVFEEKIKDIPHITIHPGGKKILQTLENILNISKEQNKFSYQILKNFGNMSSATIWYVWDLFLKENHYHIGEKMLSMAFGPGLTMETIWWEISD
jgi:alpha-pyrone synthase